MDIVARISSGFVVLLLGSSLGCSTLQTNQEGSTFGRKSATSKTQSDLSSAATDSSGIKQVGFEHLTHHSAMCAPQAPRELHKAVLPDYVIEPPDLLSIEAVALIPREPYALRTGDMVAVQAFINADVGEDEPIFPNVAEVFTVTISGTIELGIPYGKVKVAGLTSTQAEAVVREKLQKLVKDEFIELVSVTVTAPAGSQVVQGEHLVGPDGRVNLGIYGTVGVVGMNIPQAKQAIEAHLSAYIQNPQVSVDVFAYNSKVYYVVIEGAGLGDNLLRLPYTGNETVLDALTQVGGFSEVSSKRMWIARPGCNEFGNAQILPVHYRHIVKWGDTSTNYQLLPGDRVFIAEDKRVWLDTAVAKFVTPIERIMSFSTLGANTVTRFSGKVLQGGGQRGFFTGGNP